MLYKPIKIMKLVGIKMDRVLYQAILMAKDGRYRTPNEVRQEQSVASTHEPLA